MSDPNLLPNDLRKKEEKILANMGSFNDSKIEFKDSGKLKETKDDSRNSFMSSMAKWFSPKKESEVKNIDKHSDKGSLNVNNAIPKDLQDIFDMNGLEVGSESQKSQDLIIEDDSMNVKKQENLQNIKTQEKIIPKVNFEKKTIPKTEPLRVEIKSSIPFYKKLFDKLFVNKKQTEKEDKKDVNLLPENLNIPSRRKITMILSSIFVISVVSVFVIYFGILIYKIKIDNSIVSMKSEIESVNSESVAYDKLILEIESWKGRISKIKELLNEHIYWTKFFEELEANTLPEIKFNSFAGSIGGNIVLSATAPDYYTMSRQWIHLNNNKNFADNVVIGGAALSSAGDGAGSRVSFSLTMDLADNIFYKNK